MAELVVIAFLGGLITGLSPCIVPVLPVLVAGGAVGGDRRRPLAIIAGLVASFSVTVLLGSTILSALGLPQDFLYWLGIALLLALALGLIVPAVGYWAERPFRRLGASGPVRRGGGFVLGLSLGLVFVPCAGPVLTAIAAAAANHNVSAGALVVTLFYAAGTALPLLALSLLAQRAAGGWSKMRRHLPTLRRLAGAVLAVTTLAIAFGWFDPLQRDVPGFTSALENRLESGSAIASKLRSISGEQPNKFAAKSERLEKEASAKGGTAGEAKGGTATTPASKAHGSPLASRRAKKARIDAAIKAVPLPVLGTAPNFARIVAWLNTPGGRPLTMAELRGKVVLIDFWTYSCINCQRSLPHVEAWYNDYKKDGFVVVGVHTPEFAFEHVVSNVLDAVHNLGVDYPVAVDSNYGTWDAWGNEAWPADYLVDPTGHVRAYSFGEGNYGTMETDIRDLLIANGAARLPPRTDVPDKTPTAELTPESYVGNDEISNDVGTPVVKDKLADYHGPGHVPANHFAFNGWWDDNTQEATAGKDAEITLNFAGDDSYLVMGGKGTVQVSLDGRHTKTLAIGGIPNLYTLYSGRNSTTGILRLRFSAGVQAYDFTFG